MEFLENAPLRLEELNALLEACPPLDPLSQGEFEELSHRCTWSGWERGSLVAFLAGTPQTDAFHVKRLAVHPRCRRRGLARELLRRAAWTAYDQGFYRLTVTLPADNEDASAFCRRLGFQAKDGPGSPVSLYLEGEGLGRLLE